MESALKMGKANKQFWLIFSIIQLLGILCLKTANVHMASGLLLFPAMLLLMPGILIGGLFSKEWVSLSSVILINAGIWYCLVIVILRRRRGPLQS